MKRKVEFIESYIKVGNDYQWNDNHGELIRCKDCKYYSDDAGVCIGFGDGHYVMEEDFCSKAERADNGKTD